MKKCTCFFLMLISLNSPAQLTKTVYKTIAGKTIYTVESKNLYIVTTGFMIDADGSPKAYHKNDEKAQDYLSNAGKPGNWWALVTDSNGNPLLQTANDPAPGYYISMTSLEDDTKAINNPDRYVNADSIPYIAMPVGFSSLYKPGDIALVVNKKNNKRCYAIFADNGPANKIGEGSMYLARRLGIESSPKDGGIESGVVFILFRQSGNGTVLSKQEIEKNGQSKLSEDEIEELVK